MLKMTSEQVGDLRRLSLRAKELLESRKFANEHRLRVGDTGITVDVPADIVLAGIDAELRKTVDGIEALGVTIELPGLQDALPPPLAPLAVDQPTPKASKTKP